MMTALAIVGLLLQVLDFHSTYRCLTAGNGTEANPVVRFLMERFGLVPGLSIAKTLGFVCVVVLYLDGSDPAFYSLAAMNAFYAYVVASNYRIANR